MSDDHQPAANSNGHANGGGAEDELAAETAIAQLFDDYKAGFDDYEADRICDCFALPVTIWQFEEGHVFSEEEDLMDNIETLLSALEKEGVVQSEFQVSSSHINGNSAMITLDWTQEDADGEAVLEFTCHYHLIQDGVDWVIAMIINE
ncbi:hypothetical protein TRICHSKD4_0057 [Roseibium sp. TrichSKD4]|uniref:hypothetical protein n=1 Tax=Roseibium sp. TrichSKD4 TaxID=744980 RepID=UPI0001E56643|nr:hypothetical protein [Roseibium sp. TrichSKD4]EFO34279.1 hypothetical protein TRICHSKD4_0057 [Roseibium sp. TrichSKD4]